MTLLPFGTLLQMITECNTQTLKHDQHRLRAPLGDLRWKPPQPCVIISISPEVANFDQKNFVAEMVAELRRGGPRKAMAADFWNTQLRPQWQRRLQPQHSRRRR